MLITIGYAIKLLLLPPASLLFLVFIGLIFRKRRFGLPLLTMSLLCLLLLSLPVVVSEWARHWERFLPLQSGDVQKFKPQALVVIGGGIAKNAQEYQAPVTLNTRSLLRVRYAARLAKELGLPILVSGGSIFDSEYASEAQLMAEVLEGEFDTPVAWLEQQSRNTAENARYSRALLKAHDINDIVLVTQAYHMPRAAHEFRKAGFNVLPAPTAFIGYDSEFTWLDLLPSPSALMNSFLLAHESLGMLWYSIRY